MRQQKLKKSKHSQKENQESKLPAALIEEFNQFIEYHSAKQFSRNLRRMLLEFLIHDQSIESVYLKDLLRDFEGLFSLLDTIEETKHEHWPETLG